MCVTGVTITSNPSMDYNCFAWAAGASRNDEWWDSYNYWPSGVEPRETLEAYIQAYGTIGYRVCDSQALETGFEKISIYVKNGQPTHAARQLPSGRWTSKLGTLKDIEHDFSDNFYIEEIEINYGQLAEINYGQLAVIMKRPINSSMS
jgi:hypothetical protein